MKIGVTSSSRGAAPVLVGIFVGGRSSRMGGTPKGLLPSPEGPSVVARALGIAREVGDDVVLVGSRAAYAGLDCAGIDDASAGRGPLGGLVALLGLAGERGMRAIVLACDLPVFDLPLLVRLRDDAPDAPILAPRTNDGLHETLFARHDPSRVLPAARAALDAGDLSLQRLYDRVGARELPLTAAERARLVDWDRPEDIHALPLRTDR